MPSVRFFKRRWDEDRGDAHADWGRSRWYFATDENGVVREQAEVYDNGCVLLYGSELVEDEFGGLSDQPLDLAEFAPYEIDGAAYSAAIRSLTRRTA